MPKARRTGFTLFEVLLVILLLGLVAAFAWPDFYTSSRAAQLGESGFRMKALIAMCRAEAMNQARRYRLSFRLDGSIRISRQADALDEPDEYRRVRAGWARKPATLEEVWIEGVLALPYGPPPIYIDNQEIVFTEEQEEIEVPLVEDLDEDVDLYFEPDGTSGSMRWTFRDTFGRGIEMTLDGRTGRIQIEALERIPQDQVERPEREPIEDDEEDYEEGR